MAKGLSRGRSGPTPDPNALARDRKDDQASWQTLPVEGYKGKVPEWPYPKGTVREKKLWKELWATPQAAAWAALAVAPTDVAEYIKLSLEMEHGEFKFAGEVRQRRAALGLSVDGMLRNRWRVGEVSKPASKSGRSSSANVKNRLKVVK